MIEKLLYNIKNKTELRKSLIELKACIKDSEKNELNVCNIIKEELKGDLSIFEELLNDQDAKVRKNSALIMGELGDVRYLKSIFNAYMKEEQLYNKSSYLKAIYNLDYRDIITDIKKRYEELMYDESGQDNKKHLSEELHNLSDMIHAIEGFKKHEFNGFNETFDAVLLTNRNHIHIVLDELEEIQDTVKKAFNAGVMIKTKHLDEVIKLRTFKEILFCIDGMKTLSSDPIKAAKQIADSDLINFLHKMHTEPSPFYFRIELKGKLDLEKKSKFNKKLAAELENLTNRQLVNSTTNYEIEIRLIENKEGNYNTLLKLYTIKDNRFEYRVNIIPSAINPVNAALTVKLAINYIKKGAQILDPFCGIGTMLIERNQIVKAGTMYGIDIFSDAIRYARINAEAADCKVNYINRDFFDFKHEYLFDEIITDLPFHMNGRENTELINLYNKFFIKAPEHLKPGGVMILYTHNYDLMKRSINKEVFKLEKEYELSMIEGTYIFILTKRILN